MQITAPTHPAAVSRGQTGKAITVLRGHKKRAPIHLPWQVNAVITALIGLGIAACVLTQL